jgi:hypothetical protein
MQTEKRTGYLTRDKILKLLSDEEVARVSTEEGSRALADGEEYLDLDDPERGVRQAEGSITPTGRVLPRKAVHEDTWSRIVAQLNARPAVKARH